MSLEALIAKAVADAFSAIGDLAQEASLRRTARGEYDPASGSFTTYEESHPVQVVITEAKTMAGDGPARTSYKALLAPTGDLEPMVGDHLVLNSFTEQEVDYHLSAVLPTRPGRSTLLWELELER